MNSSQASARRPGARLVAVHADGAPAVELIDHVWSAGDAVLPLDTAMSETTAKAIATDLGAQRMMDAAGAVDLDDAGTARTTGVQPGHARAVASGTALVVRTSGTTGHVRGVVLSHTALDAAVAASVARLKAGSARWLGVLPLHHIAGLLVVLRARAAGTTPVLHDHFDVDRVARETAVTHVSLVPTMLRRLLDHGTDLRRFDRILLGGAAPMAGLLERATAAGARVTVSYGMTETAGGCVYDGRPLDGVAVAVDPDHGVLVRGDVLADGYRPAGDRTTDTVAPLRAAGGWFRTNDLGRFDGDRLVITGRSDDVAISGGINVSTTAVARLLERHPAVAQAAVIGVDDVEWGQRIVAFVVAVDPTSPPKPEALRAHVRTDAEQAEVPRQVLIVDSLPRTALGKIDRAALRAAVLHG